MDIEDDFIEDSEFEEEESMENTDFFLTATNANEPKEIVLKPAVNIYPVVTLAQQLLSKMYSLVMFGNSQIGATVAVSIYELGSQLNTIRNSFSVFVKETSNKINSPEYKLLKNLEALEAKCKAVQAENIQFKNLIRNNSKRLPKGLDSDTEMEARKQKVMNEFKSNAANLRRAIENLQKLKQLNDTTLSENREIEDQINSKFKQFRKNCQGDYGEISKNIVRIEIDLQNNIQKHREKIEEAKKTVQMYEAPIAMLEARLADLNRRILQVVRCPRSCRPNPHRKMY